MQQTQPGPQHFVFYRTVIIIIGLQTTKIKNSKFGVTLVEWRLSYCTVSWDFGSCEIMLVTFMNFVMNKMCVFKVKT